MRAAATCRRWRTRVRRRWWPPELTVTLNGSGSSDANGDLLRYTWTLTQRPAGSTASLSSATAVNPTFVADQPGTFQATLTASDAEFTSAPVQTARDGGVGHREPGAGGGGRGGQRHGGRPGGNARRFRQFGRERGCDHLQLDADRAAQPAAAQRWWRRIRCGPTLVPDQAGLYVATLIVSDGRLSSAPSTLVVTVTSPVVLPTHAYIRAGGGSVTTPDGQDLRCGRVLHGRRCGRKDEARFGHGRRCAVPE